MAKTTRKKKKKEIWKLIDVYSFGRDLIEHWSSEVGHDEV